MKHARRSKLQVVVQMVRMERNAHEVEEFVRFWRGIKGVDQVRIKEDETNMLRPDAGHAAEDWKHPCHYLWRGALYVKQNGDVYPCCQSYMLDGAPLGNMAEQPLEKIWNSDADAAHATRSMPAGARGEIDVCARCCTTIPHPALVAGSLLLHGKTVRRLLPAVERMIYLSKLPGKLLRPPGGGCAESGPGADRQASGRARAVGWGMDRSLDGRGSVTRSRLGNVTEPAHRQGAVPVRRPLI